MIPLISKNVIYLLNILLKKNTMLLSKYFNSYLKTRKNNFVIKKSTYKHLSLNVKI